MSGMRTIAAEVEKADGAVVVRMVRLRNAVGNRRLDTGVVLSIQCEMRSYGLACLPQSLSYRRISTAQEFPSYRQDDAILVYKLGTGLGEAIQGAVEARNDL